MTSLTNVIKSLQVEQKPVKVITLHDAPSIPSQQNVASHRCNEQQVEQVSNQLMAEARQQAQQMIAEAEETIRLKMKDLDQREQLLDQKVREAIEEAKVKGYEAGYENGKADGLQTVEQFVHEARQLVTASQIDYKNRLQEAEPMIIKLAIKMAEKVIGAKLMENPDYWKSFIATALKTVDEYEDIHIHVHPSNYEMTLQHKKELQAILHDSASIYIYPDEKLPELGCVITTAFGTIDATVDSQLAEIKNQLLEIVEEANV